jgi:hypothetical protein
MPCKARTKDRNAMTVEEALKQAATGGETTELWAALQMVLMLLEKVEYRL